MRDKLTKLHVDRTGTDGITLLERSVGVWRHKRTGGIYDVLGVVFDATADVWAVAYQPVGADPVGDAGLSRHGAEFHDGRFEKIANP